MNICKELKKLTKIKQQTFQNMIYCTHGNNIKSCFYCKINHKKEKEKFLEKNKNNEILSLTWYFNQIQCMEKTFDNIGPK